MIRYFIIGALALSISGCATITRGTNDVLEIQSTPSRAAVQTSNGHSCSETPCAIKMPRRSDLVVEVSKPGYHTSRVNVTSKINGSGAAGMAGNILFGGIVGAGVDGASGAMHDLTPNPVVVTLEPLGPTQSPAVSRGTGPLIN
jgi:hypothetical protein